MQTGLDTPEKNIIGLTADSRDVEPGYLFAALPGNNLDGRNFIDSAIDRGAVAVLAPRGSRLKRGTADVALITDENPHRTFARLAGSFYGAQPGRIAAITGTNGKSSVAEFVRQLWISAGYGAASLGTLGLVSETTTMAGNLTTPDPVRLHQILRDLAANEVSHLALEASSHGLDQYRLDGVRIAIAAFTNLSRDHLDYHASMEDYFAAKARLFTEVMEPGGVAVLNASDEHFASLSAQAAARGHRILSYGGTEAEISLLDVEAIPSGQRLTLRVGGQKFDIAFPLIGRFQADNAICALGVALADDQDISLLAPHLEKLQGVRGRLELIAESAAGASVYVDYAHTPDALETVLRSLRPHSHSRLLTVFGCGGDRDAGKRRPMGAIAERQSDVAIVTDDNPRTEDAAEIRREILAGCPDALEIGDRRAAIATAIEMAVAGDIVVVAGKGHEQGQIVGTQIIPFDDGDVIRRVVGGGAA